jgi:predicted ATPase
MLSRLTFTSFKSWPEAKLALAPITGLFGTNSSGKTSILQFLLLLKQTKDATDRALSLELNGSFVQLGTIRDAIHRHDDEASRLRFELAFRLDQDLVLRDPTGRKAQSFASGRDVIYAAEIAVHQKAPRAERLTYQLDGLAFTLEYGRSKEREFDLKAAPEDRFRFVRTQGRPWGLPGPIKAYAFPDQARTYFQNAAFLADLEAAYEAEIDRLYYLGPLREYPQRDYLWARSRPTDVGRRGEKAIDAILAATEAGEKLNLQANTRLMPFQKMVAHWLRELGLIHSFTVKEIKEGTNRWQALVVTREGGSEVQLTDVGFGVSQVLPVVTLLLYVPEGSTVILEQPEIHLHPLAQANLADVIIYAARRRRVQVILESHSEHLLLRLQRRIAEETLPAEDVALYFSDAPAGASQLTRLDLDLFGNISNWPPNFMGDAFGETAEAERARLRRRPAQAAQ